MFQRRHHYYHYQCNTLQLCFTHQETPYQVSEENKEELFSLLAVKNKRLLSVHQVHSPLVLAVRKEEEFLNHTQADGIITDDSSALILIKNADCMPIYCYSDDEVIFGVIHAGWKGAHLNIAKSITTCYQEAFNRPLETLNIVLGIAAQACCYEVSKEFMETFQQDYPTLLEGVFLTKENKIYYSNAIFLKNQFMALGVLNEKIIVETLCTMCSNEFHSYRKTKTSRRNYALMYKELSV